MASDTNSASARVLELLNLAIEDEAPRPGISCIVDAGRADSGFETAPDSPLIKLLEEATGKTAGTVAFGTEGAQMMALGSEAVVIGPGDIRVAHRTGEFVPRNELNHCCDILAHAVKSLCF
jgi:acetylornithine deacetylase